VELIEGRQPVREALRAGRPIRRILIADGTPARGTLAEILDLARRNGVRVDRLPRAIVERKATTGTHQGVLAEAAAIRARSWREGLEAARAAGQTPLLVALDGIEDPRNLGAVLRSAEVFGVHAVLVPKRRAASLGPTVAKASAGATEHLVIDQVNSLERALAECRSEGLWIVALAAEGDQQIQNCSLLEEPVVLVIGSESAGVSALVRKRSDAVVRIPTTGRIGSLNASVAAAICLWEAIRRRSS
jgi:23S rRNA (guanosine2251-2'-O)-methyltransferase